ncbi:hypothetical protein PR001_g29735 [Phytophthora rubi]|nr:hypothetical protein PR001_g29735 [Phytophthora rubi]
MLMGRVGLYGVASATNIEASSAPESSYYYHIVAVAATSVGRVRIFGVASTTNIEASSASESSYYYHIVVVTASISAVLLASLRQWTEWVCTEWRTPRTSRPSAPQSCRTIITSAQSPPR